MNERLIRPARAEDRDRLVALEAAAMGARSWGAASVAATFSADGARILIAEASGELVGFLIWRMLADAGEILSVGVAPALRGAGLGASLLRASLAAMKADGAPAAVLEVDAGNAAAIALYRRAGFGEVGARARYYRDGADALIMRRPLE